MKQEVFANGSHKAAAAVSPASPAPEPRTRASRTRDTPNVASPTGAKARPRAAAAVAPAPEFNGGIARKPVSRRLDSSFRAATEELQRKLEASERLVRELESEVRDIQLEVVDLRAELETLQRHCCDVEEQKKQLADELQAARDKIKQLESNRQSVRLKPAQQESVKNQLEQQLKVLKSGGQGNGPILKVAKSDEGAVKASAAKVSATPAPAPPPPPPPPRVAQGPSRTKSVNKATELLELYNSLTKRDVQKASVGSPTGISPHHGIVGELQNRSSHLLAIKSDVETRGDFVNHLIARVQSAAYSDMEDVLNFVDWLDQQLSTLSDETAVLKHFDWPEKKADALREAAIEYRDLKRIDMEISSIRDRDKFTTCEATLRKTTALLEKLERGMERLAKLRNSALLSYKEYRIPTDWMMEPGMPSKMKLASIKLAKVYLNSVLVELDSARSSEREAAHDALLAQSVRFAYRVHQFAGGLDSEAMCAFDKLRDRVRT